MTQITDEQLELMRHACGIGSRDPYYRDYFAASPGSGDDALWSGLVDKGFASVRREPGDLGPLRIYGVTRAGKALLGKHDQGEVFA